MVRASLGSGFASARRNVKLALLLWLSSLLIALPAWLPFSVWFSNALSFTRGADTLLTTLDLSVLREMVQYDQANVWGLVMAGLMGAAVVSVIVGALTAGGAVDVVMAERAGRAEGAPRDARRFMHRFFRGAGHFFWRNLVLLVVNLLIGGGVVALAAAGADRAVRPLEDSLSIALRWLNVAARPVVAGVLLVFFWLVLDFARVGLVRDDRRNALGVWWRAFRFTLRRVGSAYGLWLGVMVPMAIVLWLFFLAHGAVVGAGGGPAFLVVAILQLATLARAWFRVALIGSEVEFVARHAPRVAAPVPVEAVSAPAPAPAEHVAPPEGSPPAPPESAPQAPPAEG